ncbi:hypothetical protein EYF80_002131 [Liparis tanakae]|uniref:Uncharacterized protein n=1 Tax=Liparis tanakae TaxID=230148 RepID=A0A4Z2JD80_9TELE|nr:hypothetical protein EYF80_002131 [Liparis tanakae]
MVQSEPTDELVPLERLDPKVGNQSTELSNAAVTTSDAELRSMIATEKNRFLRLIYPGSAVGAVCFQLGE